MTVRLLRRDFEVSDMAQDKLRYPLEFRLFFWLLWLLGFGVFVVYFSLAMMTLGGGGYTGSASLIGVWNLVISIAEGFGLFACAIWFVQGRRSATELFWWMLVTVLVIPLIGFGGCVIQ